MVCDHWYVDVKGIEIEESHALCQLYSYLASSSSSSVSEMTEGRMQAPLDDAINKQ